MAWLSGLADKAENLLNKIDQNTAAVLSKHEYDPEDDQLIDVTSLDPRNRSVVNYQSPMTSNLPQFLTPQSTPTKQLLSSERDLTTYLKSFSSTSGKLSEEPMPLSPLSPSSLSVKNLSHVSQTLNTKDSLSEGFHSGRSCIEARYTLIDLPKTDFSYSDLATENLSLRTEIETLRNELLVCMHVEKSIESEQTDMQSKLVILRQEYEYKLQQQRQQIEHLTEMTKSLEKKQTKFSKKSLEEQNELLSKDHLDNHKQLEMLRQKVEKLKIENEQFEKQTCDLQWISERSRLDLLSTRQELEQHRARAIKTLQEKDKLITQLRGKSSNSGADNSAISMELSQLRNECNALRSENEHVCEQLRVTREELVGAGLRIEETNRKFGIVGREAQEMISREKKKRIEAEEDARAHMEELRSVKEELRVQLGSWLAKQRKQDTEISRLRSQLAAVSTPSSAVELRLATLTQTLMTKQNELEGLTTEKNALRLQLEKIEHEYRKLLGNSRKLFNVNDTDDAKAQVPTFLMETPFDTTVTRKVKRAYSSLDSISVRTGVFLRRYPLARIFVIFYIALLQFWVLVVLLFQSPEAH